MRLAISCRADTELTKGGGEKENERDERETEHVGAGGSPAEQWHWGGRSHEKLGSSLSLVFGGSCDPWVPPLVLPLLELLPSPAPGSREIPAAAESGRKTAKACLPPKLITAADIWPGALREEGSSGQGCGAGQFWLEGSIS